MAPESLITMIVVGGLAGWLAEKFMKGRMGLVMNIILGVAGAFVMNYILDMLNISVGSGIISYLIAGFAGACLLIFVGRAARR